VIYSHDIDFGGAVHRSGMNFTVVDRSRPREDRLDSSLALTWTHVTSAENDDRCSNKLITMELVAEGSARWAGTPGPGFLSPFPIAAWNLRSAPHSDAVRTQLYAKQPIHRRRCFIIRCIITDLS
jgi:hypothetical protein